MAQDDGRTTTEELTNDQKRENVIRLAFGGSVEKLNEFVNAVREAVPPDTGVALRGSAVTGERWKDGASFDAGYTFPSWAPHVRLDYVFTPTGLSSRIHRCEIVTHPAAPAASDHLPLLVEVDFV